MAKTYFDNRKLKSLIKKVNLGSKGPLRPVFRQWGSMYLTRTKREYKKNSQGGGEWPPLKAASYRRATGSSYYKTRSGRTRGSKSRMNLRARLKSATDRVSILIDTKTLFGALTINAPGNLFKYLIKRGGGIRVGFGGPNKHGAGESATIVEIAIAHQNGNPNTNLPQRKILHAPDKVFKTRMLLVLRNGMKKIGRTL